MTRLDEILVAAMASGIVTEAEAILLQYSVDITVNCINKEIMSSPERREELPKLLANMQELIS